MRADFAKVVTERPRYHGWDNIKGRKKEKELNEDFSRKREPMSMGRGTKDFTDVLGPLRKYLRSQVGRPWDKVYSECCERLNRNNNNQRHVLDTHLLGDVETKVVYRMHGKKKVPYNTEGYPILSNTSHDVQFYVCPTSNILKIAPVNNKYWKTIDRNIKEREKEKLITIDGKHYKADGDGIWYEIRLVSIHPKDWVPGFHWDIFYKRAVGNRWNWNPYGKEFTYCNWKRQLNKQEIKRLGLREGKNAA